MSFSWEMIPLGELITLQRGHDLPSSRRVEGNIPIMGSSGITGYHNEAKCVGEGVIVGRSGNSMGEISFINEAYWPLNTCLYVTDFKGNDPKYIYYLLKTVNFDQFNSGSAQKSLNRNAVYPFEVHATKDKKLQRKIGNALSQLENKVTLNFQTNQTLEQMAQAIFKSWFVDFDPVKAKMNGEQPEGMDAATASLFPEKLVESELGLIPEGWEITDIDNATSKVFSGGTPSTKNESFWGGELPWFSSGETRNNFIIETEKHITQEGVDGSSTKAATYGDVLIASAGQGYTRGQTSFNSIDCYINQSVVALRASDCVSPYWLYYCLERRYDEMRSVSDSHSSRGSLTTKLLKALPIAKPSKDIVNAFDAIVESLVRKQVANAKQNKELSLLRDTLLPKLLSGEIELGQAQELAEVE
ncbi:TPA: restriction endonuclease subunit S [Vibrio parahaemolyticus]|uniref:restriction endonuclease subunit S n=1 Tax=Vibrio parahaemolyticus TaxID=670 RepID=UPI0028067DDD|nr:restriction endonuclease subunit S [Vibrio parahaemolyticus]HCE3302896.1 restriction endonuclease subunit S [Vibrio parahaemolyticus]HCH6001497.1 restriction endonuclease subunit S [Vibrio parahaemolyticus]